MAQFIDFEVGVEADAEENDEVSEYDSDLDSLSSFIDNQENDNNVSFYQTFNVETDIDETLKTECEEGLNDIENFDKISNLCESSDEELEI